MRIGLNIQPTEPFWILMREAIIQRAQQLSIQLVMLDTEDAFTRSEKAQNDLVEEILSQDLHSFISWGMPDQVIYHLLQRGLPVIYATESNLRHPLLASADSLSKAAKLAGDFAVQPLQDGANVIILGGIEFGADGGSSRIAGYREALRSHSNLRVSYIPSPWQVEEARHILEAGLYEIPGTVDAILCLSDNLALLAREISRPLGIVTPNTRIVGIGGDPLAISAIAEGSMTATVELSSQHFGEQALRLAYQAARGEAFPVTFEYQMVLVTAQNVDDVMRRKFLGLAALPSRLIGINREQQQKRMAQLETGLEINRRINSVLDKHKILTEIAQVLRSHFSYDNVHIYRWLNEDQVFVLENPAPNARQAAVPLSRAGILREALTYKGPIYIPDVQHSQHNHNQHDSVPIHSLTRSRVLLPIRRGESIFGVLDLHSYHPSQHTQEDLVGLQLLADQLSIAMQNADLYQAALDARTRAEKADQLKTRLLANISHELRTPLNLILSYSQMALAPTESERGNLSPMLRDDLRKIYSGATHLLRLINDLLDLSRAEIGELNIYPEVFSPLSILQEVFDAMKGGSAEKIGVEWQTDLPDRLPLIGADPVRFRQILFNLLANAHKFTERGHIRLGAEVTPLHVHIWVEDTGVGIPVELQERIFEPFVTGELPDRRRREGIGLGLAITRRLVMLHAGSMTLDSQPGQGSTFHVYLPLPNLSGKVSLQPKNAQPAVLVVSSQPQMPSPVVRLAQRHQLSILVLSSGESLDRVLAETRPLALAWDITSATPTDWLLMDQIRSHPSVSQLPFILFGDVNVSERRGGRTSTKSVETHHSTSIVTKPVSASALADLIEALRPVDLCGPILIVDDDPQALALYRDIIERVLPPCYPVLEAKNGEAALQVLSEVSPALVILDLTMPQVDGFTVLERIRSSAHTAHIPVLVLSGRILTADDIKRLNHQKTVFQSKDILSKEEMGGLLSRALTGDELLPQPTSFLVKQAVLFIQLNFMENLTRQQIADAVGVSENYLSEICHQELGMSLWDYLIRYRINEAKKLLRHTTTPVQMIACQVGFDDPAYFSRVFRKLVGVSPREYRH